MQANTTGSSNVSVGSNALDYNTTGSSNVAVGRDALKANTTASESTAVGRQAAEDSEGAHIAAFGYRAVANNTTGISNTGLGHQALENCTTGDNNTAVGQNAGSASSPSGNITTGDNNFVLGNNNVANLYCADTSISSSDARDKTDVEDFKHGLSWITELRPVTYRWDRRSWYTEDPATKGTPDGSKKRDRLHIGFLAQEAIEVEKKHGYADKKDNMLIVNQDEDEADPSYGMKFERLVPVLVNAIKELSAKVEELESKLNN